MGVRFVGVGEEGSYAQAWSTPTQYMDIVSESITPDQGMIDVQTAGYRERRIRVPGGYKLEGDIELAGGPDDIGTAAYFTLGEHEQTNSASIYRHLLTPTQTLESFRMEIAPAVKDGVNYTARRCIGGLSTGLSFEAVAREALTATWSVAFQKDSKSTVTTTTPAFPTGVFKNPLVFYHGAVTFGTYGAEAAVANVEAFRCNIENNIDTDAFVIGSRFLPGRRLQEITVSGDMDVQFENWDMYKYFYDGTSTGSTPGDTVTENSLILTMTGGPTGQAGAFANFKLVISVPAITFDTADASFSTRDRIVENLAWNAVFHSAATWGLTTGYLVGVEVVNGVDITAL